MHGVSGVSSLETTPSKKLFPAAGAIRIDYIMFGVSGVSSIETLPLRLVTIKIKA
jgi:hypothetical protein